MGGQTDEREGDGQLDQPGWVRAVARDLTAGASLWSRSVDVAERVDDDVVWFGVVVSLASDTDARRQSKPGGKCRGANRNDGRQRAAPDASVAPGGLSGPRGFSRVERSSVKRFSGGCSAKVGRASRFPERQLPLKAYVYGCGLGASRHVRIRIDGTARLQKTNRRQMPSDIR